MSAILERISAHSKGEHPTRVEDSWPLNTPGGRFYAEWDTQAPTSRGGQLVFFFQFLQAEGRWEQFMNHCPLIYSGLAIELASPFDSIASTCATGILASNLSRRSTR
jgi:hypothetical protein